MLIDLPEVLSYFNEASHRKLKFDYRMGWDYDTGHQVKVVYSLDNIKITGVGDFYLDIKKKERKEKPKEENEENNDDNEDAIDQKDRDEYIQWVRENILKKGNTDHESKNQEVLSITDLVTHKPLDSVKLISPVFLDDLDSRQKSGVKLTHTLAFNKEQLDYVQRMCNKNKESVSNLKVGEVDKTPSFKSTAWAKGVTSKRLPGEDLRFNKLSKSESLKSGRGMKIHNIMPDDLPVDVSMQDDKHKYIYYQNPTRKQALQELYQRSISLLNYIKQLRAKIEANDIPEGTTREELIKLHDKKIDEYNSMRPVYNQISDGGYYSPKMLEPFRDADYSAWIEWTNSYRRDIGFRDWLIPSEGPIMGYDEEPIEFVAGPTIDGIVDPVFEICQMFEEQALRASGDIRNWDPSKLFGWMHTHIAYDKSIRDWKLKSAKETAKLHRGNCHDQSLFELKALQKMGFECGQLFFIERTKGYRETGNGHTLTWYNASEDNHNVKGNKFYWFEHAWEAKRGIYGPYDSVKDLKSAIYNAWNKDNDINSNKFETISFSDNPNYKVGMTMEEYVKSWKLDDHKFMEKNMDENLFDWALAAFVEAADDDTEEDDGNEDQPVSTDTDSESNEDNPPPMETQTGDVEEEPVEDDKESTPAEEETKKEEPKKPDSLPKQTDKAESDKNGKRRKRLYITFIEWAKEYNNRNTFGSVFDKDAFHVSYPFVPDEMRYFYRLSNPMLCVLAGDLTFFPVSELRKLNSKNKQLDDMMIFAATPNDLRVFNRKDKKVYRAEEENGTIVLKDVLGDTFDTYIQTMIGKGDILNGPDVDMTKPQPEENE